MDKDLFSDNLQQYHVSVCDGVGVMAESVLYTCVTKSEVRACGGVREDGKVDGVAW